MAQSIACIRSGGMHEEYNLAGMAWNRLEGTDANQQVRVSKSGRTDRDLARRSGQGIDVQQRLSPALFVNLVGKGLVAKGEG